jgi:hypothetical protein
MDNKLNLEKMLREEIKRKLNERFCGMELKYVWKEKCLHCKLNCIYAKGE